MAVRISVLNESMMFVIIVNLKCVELVQIMTLITEAEVWFRFGVYGFRSTGVSAGLYVVEYEGDKHYRSGFTVTMRTVVILCPVLYSSNWR